MKILRGLRDVVEFFSIEMVMHEDILAFFFHSLKAKFEALNHDIGRKSSNLDADMEAQNILNSIDHIFEACKIYADDFQRLKNKLTPVKLKM